MARTSILRRHHQQRAQETTAPPPVVRSSAGLRVALFDEMDRMRANIDERIRVAMIDDESVRNQSSVAGIARGVANVVREAFADEPAWAESAASVYPLVIAGDAIIGCARGA